MTDTLYLSPSKLDSYARCGVAFENRYLLGKRELPGMAALTGRAIDAAVSASLVRKVEDGKLPSEVEVATIAGEEATRELAAAGSDVLLEPDEKEAGLPRTQDKAKDRSVRMAVAYRRLVAPLVRPFRDWREGRNGKPRIQHSWELAFPGDVILRGRSDVEEVDGGVRDTKSKAKRAPDGLAESSLQLTAYGLARYSIDGHDTVPVTLDVLVDRTPAVSKLLKGTDPAGVTWQLLQSVRTKQDFYSYMGRVEQTAKSIRAGVFMPAQPDDWICSARWCSFWGSCPHAARPRHFAVGAPEGLEREDVHGDEEA